jgi:ABC-type nitrate/sulfonate/bicarbonate transport system substrate-binding protein
MFGWFARQLGADPAKFSVVGSRNIPCLGVAAHAEWVEKNRDLIPNLYATYKEAREWTASHPDEASKLIMVKGSEEDRKAIASLIRANDRLGMNIRSAAEGDQIGLPGRTVHRLLAIGSILSVVLAVLMARSRGLMISSLRS